jgi:hypothetical protein
MSMKRFIADLHIHTCLSPCAELDMTPRRIIDKAVEKGLDMIAVSDHNSAENVGVAVKIASDKGITLLPAIEITSSEEAHILALFETVDKALKMQEVVYESLAEDVRSKRLWGHQVVVNEKDEVLGFNHRLLMGATRLSAKAVVDEVHALGGLAIASHVDREAFSLISQLGFIPEDVSIDALEVTRPSSAGEILKQYFDMPWVCSSDAHQLDDVGRRTTSFFLKEASFDEVVMALKGIKGREVQCN